MRNTQFTPDALDDLGEWAKVNPKMVRRIVRILDECCRTPFEGIGKPEPLKGNFAKLWSRRVDEEHRLVYEVTDEEIIVFSLRGHYE